MNYKDEFNIQKAIVSRKAAQAKARTEDVVNLFATFGCSDTAADQLTLRISLDTLDLAIADLKRVVTAKDWKGV